MEQMFFNAPQNFGAAKTVVAITQPVLPNNHPGWYESAPQLAVNELAQKLLTMGTGHILTKSWCKLVDSHDASLVGGFAFNGKWLKKPEGSAMLGQFILTCAVYGSHPSSGSLVLLSQVVGDEKGARVLPILGWAAHEKEKGFAKHWTIEAIAAMGPRVPHGAGKKPAAWRSNGGASQPASTDEVSAVMQAADALAGSLPSPVAVTMSTASADSSLVENLRQENEKLRQDIFNTRELFDKKIREIAPLEARVSALVRRLDAQNEALKEATEVRDSALAIVMKLAEVGPAFFEAANTTAQLVANNAERSPAQRALAHLVAEVMEQVEVIKKVAAERLANAA